jgi:hypothetical protein
VIKCNRCGKMTPSGAFCQSCGAPLAGMVENETSQSSPKMVYQDQPEVPAWLESLRAGERPAAPVNNATNFSPSDLIDEGTLPNWMRSERSDARGNTATNSPNPTYSAPSPTPAPDPVKGSSKGFQAQSLIDEKSLPSWMKSGSAPSPTPSPDPVRGPSEGFQAQSLIDEKSLPSWMQAGNQVADPPTSPGGLSASSLVQPDNLPDWMKTLQQQQPSTKQPNAAPVNQPGRGAPAFSSPEQPTRPPSSVTSGFAARDLIDQQSLPSWMKPQGERATDNSVSFPFNQNQAAQSGPPAGQPGFSASSLLDVDTLPSWLREGSQNSGQYPRLNTNAQRAVPGTGQNPAQAAWPAAAPSNAAWPAAAPSNAAWPAAAPINSASAPAPMPPVTPMGQQNGGALAASSFIDSSSLPTWLRSGQQQNPPASQQATPPVSRPAPYAVPPRVDNMRVPSRPRGEVIPTETSEMAANVFASMLGVASAAPNYPASNQQPDQPGQSKSYGQSNQQSAQSNSYGQAGQGSSASSYGQAGQGSSASSYGQTGQGSSASQYGQSGQSAQNLYSGQLEQPGLGQAQANASGQWSQSAMSQSQPQSIVNGFPSLGAVPNTPAGAGNNAFPQNYNTGNSFSGNYGNNSYPGNAGQANSGMGSNASMSGMPSMGNNQSMNGSSSMNNNSNSYYPNNAQSMSNSPAQSSASDGAGELKNKKRSLFESIREWLSR